MSRPKLMLFRLSELPPGQSGDFFALLAERVKAATDHELKEQTWLRATEDFKEGVKATEERRVANFKGR